MNSRDDADETLDTWLNILEADMTGAD